MQQRGGAQVHSGIGPRNFEDIVPIFRSIEWLSDEERRKITEGNARKIYTRMVDKAKL